MKTRVLLTTGGLGTDFNALAAYAIHTPQGLAACRKLAEHMAGRTREPVTVYTWANGQAGRRVLAVNYGGH
jgi:hypothetical protein